MGQMQTDLCAPTSVLHPTSQSGKIPGAEAIRPKCVLVIRYHGQKGLPDTLDAENSPLGFL
jgi:hypothetical protein